jgi:translation initiation factor IF-3
MDVDNALKIANSQNLDLVMVNKDENSPVCKLMDYGKYCYDRGKEAQRKNKKPPKEKEFHVRPNTQKYDIDIALKKAISHIEKKNHVSFYMDTSYREANAKDKIQNKIKYIIGEMLNVSKIDKENKTNKSIIIHFVPKAEE